MDKLKIGDNVYIVFDDTRWCKNREAKISKVGNKYYTLDFNDIKINISDLYGKEDLQCKLYKSKEIYENMMIGKQMFNELKGKYCLCPTKEQMVEVYKILGLEKGDQK